MCSPTNLVIMSTTPVSQMNQMLSFDGRVVNIDDVMRLLHWLEFEGFINTQDFWDYHLALADHYHRGILPGEQRFFSPDIVGNCGTLEFLLVALGDIYRTFVDVEGSWARIDALWMEEPVLELITVGDDGDMETTGMSSVTLSDADLLDPDSVIDEALQAACEFAYETFGTDEI